MLEHLAFRNVGPAPHMAIDFKPRINLLAGDNGLGKTFLLDGAWWALTRTWARGMLMPRRPVRALITVGPKAKAAAALPPPQASITYRYKAKTGKTIPRTSIFDRSTEVWPLEKGRPAIPGLVLYAQVDGAFSVWDPARNYWKGEDPDRPPAFLLQPDEVWDGAPRLTAEKFCNGLISDWTNWQLEGGEAFAQLSRVLAHLSPSADEPLEPGGLRKISLADARRHPTLKMPYGEVPLVHASAGVRRIVALGYLLVWAWQEHLAACELIGDKPSRKIIFLIDEVEAHLHPKWQRRILPALLDVMDALTGRHGVQVQLIAATHWAYPGFVDT